MKSKRTELVHVLANCIIKSIDGTEFKWDTFFKLWFREHGNPLFFLFKKNLSVTNTQYVELFSLLTLHSKSIVDTTEVTKLLFYSTEHIKITFTEVIITLLEDYTPGDKCKFIEFSERYLDIFSASAAVDVFFGSCAVFLSPCIFSDIENIVFESGYIHSAGKSVFIRNIKKAKKNELFNSIDSHLKQNPNLGDEIPFVVYSHEDFSEFDKGSTDLIEKGIEQCKIYLEKMSMGSHRLTTIINEMQSQKYVGKLFIPKPGNFQINHNFKQGRTLWLICDKSISGGQIRNPGTSRYYICYEQTVKNDSPFFFFDENKPAWKSHTTLPHSLTAALLNIARPIVDNGVICDPFAGTGTTWLEVKRLQLNNEVKCSDLSPAAVTLHLDNIEFFCKSSKELTKLVDDIKSTLINEAATGQGQLKFSAEITEYSPYDEMLKLLEELKHNQKEEDMEFELSQSFVSKLNAMPFLSRVIFYIGLRSELRFQSGFKRKSLTFETAYKKSAEKIIDQIKMLIELKSNEEEPKLNHVPSMQNKSYKKTMATYSYRLTPSIIYKSYKEISSNISTEVFSSTDARSLIAGTNDLIICDPPYGFNTTEDGSGLAQLYCEFIDKAIASLRSGGQLILCLPAESYTGRDLPYCTRSDLISRQVLVKAHMQGRIVFQPAKSLPLTSLSPPYYWESDRALRRTILHFRFI